MHTALIALSLIFAQRSHMLRTPALIQALQDVHVGGDASRSNIHFLRVPTPNRPLVPFLIKKGERFEMLKDLGNGHCRIRFRKRVEDVMNCYWLPGYSDQHSDVFKVLTGFLSNEEAKTAPRPPSVD
jgi:hypothetical protein